MDKQNRRSVIGINALTDFSNVDIESSNPEMDGKGIEIESAADVKKTIKRCLSRRFLPLAAGENSLYGQIYAARSAQSQIGKDDYTSREWNRNQDLLQQIVVNAISETTERIHVSTQDLTVLRNQRDDLDKYRADVRSWIRKPVESIRGNERTRYNKLIGCLAGILKTELTKRTNIIPPDLNSLAEAARRKGQAEWRAFASFLEQRLALPFLTEIQSINPSSIQVDLSSFLANLNIGKVLHEWNLYQQARRTEAIKNKHRSGGMLTTSRPRGDVDLRLTDDGEIIPDLMPDMSGTQLTQAGVESWLAEIYSTHNKSLHRQIDATLKQGIIAKARGSVPPVEEYKYRASDARASAQGEHIRSQLAQQMSQIIAALDLLIDSAKEDITTDDVVARLGLTETDFIATQELDRLTSELSEISRSLDAKNIPDPDALHYVGSENETSKLLRQVQDKIDQLLLVEPSDQRTVVAEIGGQIERLKKAITSSITAVGEDLANLKKGNTYISRQEKSSVKVINDQIDRPCQEISTRWNGGKLERAVVTPILPPVEERYRVVDFYRRVVQNIDDALVNGVSMHSILVNIVQENPNTEPDKLVPLVIQQYADAARHQLIATLPATLESISHFMEQKGDASTESYVVRLTDTACDLLTNPNPSISVLHQPAIQDVLMDAMRGIKNKIISQQRLQNIPLQLDRLLHDIQEDIKTNFSVTRENETSKRLNNDLATQETTISPETIDQLARLEEEVRSLREQAARQQAEHTADLNNLRTELATQMRQMQAQIDHLGQGKPTPQLSADDMRGLI